MSQEGDLDRDIDQQSNKKKYLTWIIIAVIVIAVIAIPMAVLRGREPAEATEPATIEQLEAEIDALYLTVYGTEEVDGLETKLALQAEAIADFQAGDCTCPDYSGQIQDINNDLILLRTDLDAVPDYASNITGLITDLDALSADLTVVQTSLTELQAEVDTIAVTDWTSDIDYLSSEVGSIDGDIAAIEGEIESLWDAIASLPTSLPQYATVTELSEDTLTIGIYGAGDYPVIITLYGAGLLTSEAWIWSGEATNCVISYELRYAVGAMLAIIVEPADGESWDNTDTITLVVNDFTGGINYATASVGRGT